MDCENEPNPAFAKALIACPEKVKFVYNNVVAAYSF